MCCLSVHHWVDFMALCGTKTFEVEWLGRIHKDIIILDGI